MDSVVSGAATAIWVIGLEFSGVFRGSRAIEGPESSKFSLIYLPMASLVCREIAYAAPDCEIRPPANPAGLATPASGGEGQVASGHRLDRACRNGLRGRASIALSSRATSRYRHLVGELRSKGPATLQRTE
jgi:hypothetical protein